MLRVKIVSMAVEFNFPGVSGSLVSRRLPKGRRYALELYFQGEDNTTIADAFETSADDPRPWTLSHPLYGQLTVQPLSLSFDNSKMNSTRVTGTVVETITDQYPRATTNATNQVQQPAQPVWRLIVTGKQIGRAHV